MRSFLISIFSFAMLFIGFSAHADLSLKEEQAVQQLISDSSIYWCPTNYKCGIIFECITPVAGDYYCRANTSVQAKVNVKITGKVTDMIESVSNWGAAKGLCVFKGINQYSDIASGGSKPALTTQFTNNLSSCVESVATQL
jgi:hypothetical protein